MSQVKGIPAKRVFPGAIGLLFQGVKLIGSANAATLSTLEPVSTLAIGVRLLSEAMTIEKLVDEAMIEAAASLIARQG